MLFTFPSRYSFTIGHSVVFSLTRWCWQIHARFLRPRATQDTSQSIFLLLTGLSPSLVLLSNSLQFQKISFSPVLQPRSCRNKTGLGCSLFARRYLGNHYCFLFLRVLRCFSSPGLPPASGISHQGRGCPIRISPDHWLFAPTRSFSQLTTSFFASECLGILHVLLFTFSS